MSGGRDVASSLMVMTTTACNLDCAYCGVRRGGAAMGWETLRGAVELLLTAPGRSLELRWFGGEPLLRWDMMRRGADYAAARAAFEGRSLGHMLTTNGLLLDAGKLAELRAWGAEVMLSCDGSEATHRRARADRRGRPRHAEVRAALDRLLESGIGHFVNAVVRPDALEDALEDLELLAVWGARRIQIAYQVGCEWGARGRRDYLALLEAAARLLTARGVEVLNLRNDAEPVMLSDELIVDVDGAVYLDGAIFVERPFPRLREALRVGRVGASARLPDLRRERAAILRLWRGCYPEGTSQGRVLADNLALGLEAGRRMRRLGRQAARV